MTSRSVPPEDAPRPTRGTRPSEPVAPLELGAWTRALELARHLHSCDERAAHVAALAVSRLDARLQRQGLRRRYRPKARRTKAVRNPPQMLQQLVLEAASDTWERHDERNAATPPSADSLLRRYVTFLVQAAARRNVLHVVVAICRLLHRLTTRETLSVLDFVSGPAATACDDSYVRSRKRVLLAEVHDRFAGRLALQNDRRGTTRFRGRLAHPDEREIVRRALTVLVPWGTACAIDDDPSDASDMAQIHRLVHPPCFDRLLGDLGIEATQPWIPDFLGESAPARV